MLPNLATRGIAEQFGTQESLYPGRIDLGLGRAPGTDQATALALRRTLNSNPEDFPMMVEELEGYFSDNPVARVRAVPGEGLHIPIWLLGDRKRRRVGKGCRERCAPCWCREEAGSPVRSGAVS